MDPGRTRPTISRESDLRLAALLLTGTGLAALGHQVIWTRRMIDLLGASTESTVRVFVCFFLGLALGAASVSSLVSRIKRPWLVLAGVELGVALACVPILTLPYWSGWLWPTLGPDRLVSGMGVIVKTGVSLLILLPPTILMGMTFPLVLTAVSLGRAGPQIETVRLYALNTLGGVLGLVMVVGFSIRHLGLPGSMALLAGINLLLSVACFRRSMRQPASQPLVGAPGGGGPRLPPLAVGLAVFSGAGCMGVEVSALELLNLSIPASFYAPAAVLFCVILLLAVSALLAPHVIRWFDDSPRRAIPPSLAVAGLAVTLMPLILLAFSGARTAGFVYADSFGGFLGKTAGYTLVALGPAILFSGLAFPLALSLSTGGGWIAGRQLGLLLAANGLGGVVGAETARLVLIPAVGVHVAVGIIGIAYAVAAIGTGLGTRAPHPVLTRVVPMTGLVAAVVVTLAGLTSLPLFYWGSAYTVIEVRSGPEGVLSVFEREGFGRGLSFNNQYLLGGSGASADEQRQSHIPLLLHPAPERVCYAGLGSGITASGALKHAAVKSVSAIELSALVVDAARRHFADFNDNLVGRTNVAVHVEDARTYLAACKEQFDVIVGDLFTPWRPGEAGLASQEYFRSSIEALRPGGVFCQWIPLHQLTEQEFRIIQSTFRSVYPRVHAFRNHLKTSNIPVALVGFKEGVLDWEVVRDRCATEREVGTLTDPLCRHPEGIAMLYFGQLDDGPPGTPINTLANLRVEIDAGLNLVVPRPGRLYSYANDGNPYLDFVRQRRAAWPSDDSVPAEYRPLPDVGLLVTRLEIAHDVNHPGTAELAAELRSRFPVAIHADTGADWSLWAGSPATLDPLRSPVTPALPGR